MCLGGAFNGCRSERNSQPLQIKPGQVWGALELSRETALSHVDGDGAGTRSQCPVQSGGQEGSRGLDLICFWTLSAAPYLLLPPHPSLAVKACAQGRFRQSEPQKMSNPDPGAS